MTEQDKQIHVHIDSSEVRKDLIGFDAEGNCARCHGQLESGFGLAGGGFGVYYYCTTCNEVVDKTQVDE